MRIEKLVKRLLEFDQASNVVVKITQDVTAYAEHVHRDNGCSFAWLSIDQIEVGAECDAQDDDVVIHLCVDQVQEDDQIGSSFLTEK